MLKVSARVPEERSPAAPAAKSTSKSTPAPAPAPASGSAIRPHLESFFDTNHDGRISLYETYVGLRRLDIGIPSAAAVALGINFGLGALSLSNPLSLPLDKMTSTRHPGDSQIIDPKGRFDAARFEQVFQKYAKTFGDALTFEELMQLRSDDIRRGASESAWGLVSVPINEAAAAGELGLLFYAGAEQRDGVPVLTKERFRAFYTEPDLFWRLAEVQAEKREERSRTLGGRLVNAVRTWTF
jgi:hypothetical protein